MFNPKRIASEIVRALFLSITARDDNFRIVSGRLKGKILPRSVYRDHLGMLLGRYEPHVVASILSFSGNAEVAYDVGAHQGFLTLALAECVGSHGKVFAFEPAPENLRVMEEVVRRNGLQHMVHLMPVGLADRNGEQNLIHWMASSMYLLESALDGQETRKCSAIRVMTRTLDSLVFDGSIPGPHLIKMDVEGAEALVIHGGLRTLETYSPTLIIEVHGAMNAKKVWNLLDLLDYQWWRIDDKKPERVLSRQNLARYFSSESWTHHFLLKRQVESKPS